jgi:hypothetical protein
MLEILKILINPTVVLAMIAIWIGTSVYGGVTEWIDKREITRTYVDALVKRDRAAKFKDDLIQAVTKDKEVKDAELDELREQIEAADRARPASAVKVDAKAGADCTWSDYDIRVLNGRSRRSRN